MLELMPIGNVEDGTHRQIKHLKMTVMDRPTARDIKYEVDKQTDKSYSDD